MSDRGFNRGDFRSYYEFSPAGLAVREAVRLTAVRDIDLAEPILDVGCGDGLFARLAYPEKQIWGIDINPVEIKRAQATNSYQTLVCGNVCDVALPPEFFASSIANCSLEHVPEIDRALSNIRKSLVPGALFVLIVPTPDWSRKLALPELLKRAGLDSLAVAYGDALDRVFKHVHLHDDGWWNDKLELAGFEPVETRTIVSRANSWVFEALLPPSGIGWGVKKLTGRWVLAPSLRALTEPLSWRFVDKLHQLIPDGEETTAEYLIIARAGG